MASKLGSDRLIKKYPNRRLYDTQASTYITLLDVKRMVLEKESFKVVDAKNGDDLTRNILLQIILDEESGGVPMFSSSVLSQIIRFYGHAMQDMLGSYLEKNIQSFVDMQDAFVEHSAADNAIDVSHDRWLQGTLLPASLGAGSVTGHADHPYQRLIPKQDPPSESTRGLVSALALAPPPSDGEES
jgi:polyhydroxyalkanoate synthesis repressor PhaR